MDGWGKGMIKSSLIKREDFCPVLLKRSFADQRKAEKHELLSFFSADGSRFHFPMSLLLAEKWPYQR